MIEIRLHGRGGQGAVSAAQIIAQAAFYDGKYSQAFPSFGVERRGAPVMAFARIADQPIQTREQIYQPDYIIVQDPTLMNDEQILLGLKSKTTIIVNSEKNICPKIKNNCFCVPVTKLAIQYLGRPITNTGLLVAFATITSVIKFKSLEKAVREQFKNKPKLIDKNIELMKKVCDYCQKEIMKK